MSEANSAHSLLEVYQYPTRLIKLIFQSNDLQLTRARQYLAVVTVVELFVFFPSLYIYILVLNIYHNVLYSNKAKLAPIIHAQ